jgi:hypothetical protein
MSNLPAKRDTDFARAADKPSENLIAHRGLRDRQKSPHEFSFTTYGHARKPLEPLARRHLGILIEPAGEQAKLAGGNLALLDPIK